MMSNMRAAIPQDWRATALLEQGGDRLICLGATASEVRATYAEAYFEVLCEFDRPHVQTITLERWSGSPHIGRWVRQADLSVPSPPAAALDSM